MFETASGAKHYVAVQIIHTISIEEFIIGVCKIIALVDTSRYICLIHADQYIKLGSLTSVPEETRCRGVGLNKNVTPGEFLVELTVDGNSYSVLIQPVHSVANTEETKRNNEHSIIRIVCLSHARMLFDTDPALTYIYTTGLNENIMLGETNRPIFRSTRRVRRQKEKVNKQVNKWTKISITENGNMRLCIDYRKLNKDIIRDRYPLPKIKDLLDLLQNARIFSISDLKNGFFTFR
ncbi:hypothetical protein HZH68_001162 [Vespula germanica]|uniref:Reverse transcriptase domain-containing protein n=1 Tax=Vespula germanica TaxID=30212 RepID=A0A834NVJ0_VESGE|nr:hypothetical protein HZH68_001162 [Vespula germanica]